MRWASIIHESYFAPLVTTVVASIITAFVLANYFSTNEAVPIIEPEFEEVLSQLANNDNDVSIKTADGELFSWKYKLLGFTVESGSRETYEVVIKNPQEQPLENCRLIRSRVYASKNMAGGRLRKTELTSSEGFSGPWVFPLPATKEGLFYFFDEFSWAIDNDRFINSEIKLRLMCDDVVTHWLRINPNNIEVSHSTG